MSTKKNASGGVTIKRGSGSRVIPHMTQIASVIQDDADSSFSAVAKRELQGTKAIEQFREMADLSPVIGACLLAIEMLIRKVEWRVDEGEGAEERKRADLLRGMLDDMSHSWEEVVSEILSMLTYGFAYNEIVYKMRKGPDQSDVRYRSQFRDGLIGWRKWVNVPQDSLKEWKVEEDGGVIGMVQTDQNFKERTIPIQKALHFGIKVAPGKPMGRSLLLNAWMPWQFVKRIQEFEGIGVERDLAGLPAMFMPPEYLADGADANDAAFVSTMKKLVTGVRRGEQEGLLLPMAFDDENNPLFEFKLLATGGMRQFDTGKIVERYERRMAMSLLSDFILMGHERVGSLALSRDKTTLIGRAISAILASIASVINRHEVPRLYRLNAWKSESPCLIKPGDAENVDLKVMGAYVRALVSVGAITPDERLESFLRLAGGIPPLDITTARAPESIPGKPDDEEDEEDEGEEEKPDKKPDESDSEKALTQAVLPASVEMSSDSGEPEERRLKLSRAQIRKIEAELRRRHEQV